MVNYEKNRLDGIILNNLEVILDKNIKDLDKIKDVFKENDILVNNIVIDNDIIMVEIDAKIKSLFGKILNFDLYKLKVIYKGDYLEKKINKVRW